MATTIRVRGLVQGVGFRPLVWRIAHRLGLRGDVCNDGSGVLIRLALTGEAQLGQFVLALRNELPPLARIDQIERSPLADFEATGFEIVPSIANSPLTGIVPDAATCPACLAEMRDPSDRRHRYPFINCTHCGPRLSIIRAIPYDRANTSMAAFELCDQCATEYRDPADRRYHAQPNACPVCGPKLWIAGKESVDALASAQACLRAGGILALKGIGGFQLACDAGNPDAVELLRLRKQRYAKPFALMAPDLETIERYCEVGSHARDALSSPAAPIVLLRARDNGTLPKAIAPDSRELGFMLPYSPLHHLLLEPWDSPLVMTSGNLSDEPQCLDNQDARKRLADLADEVLMHDREIVNRVDDSVLRIMAGEARPLRRARGYAPAPLLLHQSFSVARPVLALGGDLKNTFCLLDGSRATLSPHIGDLQEARTRDAYHRSLDLFLEVFAFQPEVIAFDLHPGYHGHAHGTELAQAMGAQPIAIQHHHAHTASVMAEHGLEREHPPVLGIALDGLGFGADGTFWGGEILLADFRSARRLAHLNSVPLPGGDRAAREPWRNLYAQLHQHGLTERALQTSPDLPFCRTLRDKPLEVIDHMLRSGLNSPLSSSAGRLFDAVAAALDLHANGIHHEAQAGMALEQLATRGAPDTRPYPWRLETTADPMLIDSSSLWPALFEDLHKGRPSADIALAFHLGLAEVLLDAVEVLARRHATEAVALSGGVLQNRILLEHLHQGLLARGLRPLLHREVPANDGGISLGQAAVAAAMSCT